VNELDTANIQLEKYLFGWGKKYSKKKGREKERETKTSSKWYTRISEGRNPDKEDIFDSPKIT